MTLPCAQNPPEELTEWQNWFTKILKYPPQPLEDCVHKTLEERFHSADEHILKTSNFSSSELMEIYCFSYWSKTLYFFEDVFPFAIRILGFKPFFSEIGIPYLIDHPFYEFSIKNFGEHLETWVKKNYFGQKKQLLLSAIQFDAALRDVLFASYLPELAHIDENSFLLLQPSIFLLHGKGDFLSYRKTLVSHAVEQEALHVSFDRTETHYFMILCTLKHKVVVRRLSRSQFFLLKAIQKGSSYPEAYKIFKKSRPSLAELWGFDELLEHWKLQNFFVGRPIAH